jgi:hypothetical protein
MSQENNHAYGDHWRNTSQAVSPRAMQLSVCRGRPLCLPGGRTPTGGHPYRRNPLDNWSTKWPWLALIDKLTLGEEVIITRNQQPAPKLVG